MGQLFLQYFLEHLLPFWLHLQYSPYKRFGHLIQQKNLRTFLSGGLYSAFHTMSINQHITFRLNLSLNWAGL